MQVTATLPLVTATLHRNAVRLLARHVPLCSVLPQTAVSARRMSGDARVWCLARPFDGAARLEDFRQERRQLQQLQDGQVLLQAEFLSVDPYMKAFAAQMKPGDVMPGAQVAKVVESRAAGMPVGRRVLVSPGWCDLTVCDPTSDRPGGAALVALPDTLPVAASHYVGLVGMTGLTAYHVVHQLLRPQPGQLVVVSAAAGAVGSLVGQMAKIGGARVVGYAGSDEKVAFLKEKLHFDEAFNYKKQDLAETLGRVAANGVDAFFDAVGGSFSTTVSAHMAMHGRIAVIGAISAYNDKTPTAGGPFSSLDIIMKQLEIRGWQYFAQQLDSQEMTAARQQLASWLSEGRLQAEETMSNGFDSMPQAFIDMMSGKSTGKMVVKG